MADATNTTTAQTVPSIDDQITALQADVADLKNQVAELKTTQAPDLSAITTKLAEVHTRVFGS